jgi:DNA-binding SARP family transcriptional activator
MVPLVGAGEWWIRLLGGFEIVGPEGRVEVPPSVQRVVAYLALHAQAVPRNVVAAHIWPDIEPARARSNLRTTVWRLGPATAVVRATQASLAIAATVRVDLAAVERQAADARGSERVLLDHLDGFDLALLPGWDDEWVQLERERVRQVELHLLDDIIASGARDGRHGDAVDAALRAIRLDPLREASQAALLRAYLAGGNRAAALEHFRRFTRLMRQELGLPPSPELMKIVGEMLPARTARRT